MSLTFGALLFAIFGTVYCAPPEVPCPAPFSPEHGQAFLYQEGQVVKYICEPGYALQGKEIVRCVEGKWEEPNPACLEIGIDGIKENSEKHVSEPIAPPSPRPLFSWGSDNEQEINATAEELPLSDEARVRLLMLPRRRVITEVRTGKITELEEEEKKDSTIIHIDSKPSVVRRIVIPGKSEIARKTLHLTLENGNDVELVSLPGVTVSADGKIYHPDWFPGKVALVENRGGRPVVMTLTESQLAWINSLPADLRDQYLKDMYIMRGGDVEEPVRMQTIVAKDAYNYVYRVPYPRRAVSLTMEEPVATYDYSCHVSGRPFVKPENFRNMHIARYDKRQNPNFPFNYYLAAVYRCNPGYVMLDTRYTELYCSKEHWVGITPVCVRRY